MSYPNEIPDENDDSQESTQAQAPESKESKKFSEAEVQQLIKGRLAKEERAKVALQAEIEDLKQRVHSGKATTQEVAQNSQVQNIASQAQAQGLPPEHVAAIKQQAYQEFQHQAAHQSFQQKLTDAAEKDPEFKKLIGDDKTPQTGNLIHPDLLDEFMHLPNAAAVIKHLKKDSRDYGAAAAIPQRHERIKFFNELSEKLERNASKPGPSSYTPEPDLSDIGTADQDDLDVCDYIRSQR